MKMEHKQFTIVSLEKLRLTVDERLNQYESSVISRDEFLTYVGIDIDILCQVALYFRKQGI